MNIQEIQIIAQLTDSMLNSVNKIEQSYSNKDGVKFNESKNEILEFQRKINQVINNQGIR